MLISVWQVKGELYGISKVYGCENPPVCTPDGVRAHFKKIMPELVITEDPKPHPGGIAVAKGIIECAKEETLSKAAEIDAALHKVVDGATWHKTETFGT